MSARVVKVPAASSLEQEVEQSAPAHVAHVASVASAAISLTPARREDERTIGGSPPQLLKASAARFDSWSSVTSGSAIHSFAGETGSSNSCEGSNFRMSPNTRSRNTPSKIARPRSSFNASAISAATQAASGAAATFVSQTPVAFATIFRAMKAALCTSTSRPSLMMNTLVSGPTSVMASSPGPYWPPTHVASLTTRPSSV
mmetsp:Transcript_56501/g.157475  ORF Transcript_56501/g.157475 Transcript_56501/m.157475 type:complete len:201 (-) Transcript_56501:300-902(-)